MDNNIVSRNKGEIISLSTHHNIIRRLHYLPFSYLSSRLSDPRPPNHETGRNTEYITRLGDQTSMAPHIQPSCAPGERGCIVAGTFFGILFSLIIVFIAAFIFVTLWKKRLQKKQIQDRDLGNEHVWFYSNYGANPMQNLPPQQANTLGQVGAHGSNRSIAHQEDRHKPKSSSDLWRQRGFEMSGAAPKAAPSGPLKPATTPEETDVGKQSAKPTPLRRSEEKRSGTPIADSYMSSFTVPRVAQVPPYAASRPSPYFEQRRAPSSPVSVKSPSGTPIADSFTSPRLSFAASRTSTYIKQGRMLMPKLSVDTLRAQQPTVEDEVDRDLGARPPNPRQTSSVEGRSSKFKEHLESPTIQAGALVDPEAFEEVPLSPPPRKSTTSDFGSPSRQSFSSIFSGGFPSSWGRVVKS